MPLAVVPTGLPVEAKRHYNRRVIRPLRLLPPILMTCAALLPVPAVADAPGPAIAAWPQCLAGRYDGGQLELAARLLLGEDGRFGYELSYGALDEMAQGRWDAGDVDAFLTSDPVDPPRYALVSDQPVAERELRVKLQLPRGISAQFFDVLVGFADGARMIRQLSDEGIAIPLEPGQVVQSVAIMLPVYDVQSEPFPVAPANDGGRQVSARFDPNDLGKVAFARQRLTREGTDLLLERHGRTLRFRPEGRGCLGR